MARKRFLEKSQQGHLDAGVVDLCDDPEDQCGLDALHLDAEAIELMDAGKGGRDRLDQGRAPGGLPVPERAGGKEGKRGKEE
jgi:hypothetical protein